MHWLYINIINDGKDMLRIVRLKKLEEFVDIGRMYAGTVEGFFAKEAAMMKELPMNINE